LRRTNEEEETWAIDPAGLGMIGRRVRIWNSASILFGEQRERFPGGIFLYHVAVADRPE
jgi:hypothetical protein